MIVLAFAGANFVGAGMQTHYQLRSVKLEKSPNCPNLSNCANVIFLEDGSECQSSGRSLEQDKSDLTLAAWQL